MDRRSFLRTAFSAATAPLWAFGEDTRGAPQRSTPRPNILFIMTDQQFADVMSCRMGRTYIHTPAMDRLAKEGTLFAQAYSPNPLCMPARSSIFTGRYPHETRVTQNARPPGGRLAAEFSCMGTYLKNAGYQTAYSGKWHLCLDEKDPDTHGFEILDSRTRLTPAEADNYDARVSHAAIQFLKRKHEQPFLLVASFMNPHNICEWARRLAGRKQRLSCGEIGTPPDASQLPPAPDNLEVPKHEPDGMRFIRRAYQVADGKFPVGNFTPEDWRKDRWGYYRMTEKVDGEMAQIMAALAAEGLDDNTLVIFTSDHGDCAGAHRFNQKTVFYEESVRIPLIVRWKGQTLPSVCDKLINTGIDILPTLLDAARIQQPAQLPGRSLLPLTRDPWAIGWRDHLVSQNNMSQTGKVDGIRPTMEGRMVRSKRYKYCLYAHGARREALYDMERDPLETINIAVDPRHRQTVLEHRELLRAFAAKHRDTLVDELLANDVEPRPFGLTPDKGI